MSSVQISNKTSTASAKKTKGLKITKKTKTDTVLVDSITLNGADITNVFYNPEHEDVCCVTCGEFVCKYEDKIENALDEAICDNCYEHDEKFFEDEVEVEVEDEVEVEEAVVLTGKIDKKDMKMLGSIGATYEELRLVQDKIEKCVMLNSRHLAIYDAFKTDTTEGRKQKQAFVMKLQCSPQMLDMLQKALKLPSSFSREGGYTQDAIKAGIEEFVMGCWDKLRSYEAMRYFDGDAECERIVAEFINTDFLGGFLNTDRGVEVMGLKQREHEERVGHKRKNMKKPGLTKTQVIDTMTDEELMEILKARQANKA
jgi:hypothetical protein